MNSERETFFERQFTRQTCFRTVCFGFIRADAQTNQSLKRGRQDDEERGREAARVRNASSLVCMEGSSTIAIVEASIDNICSNIIE